MNRIYDILLLIFIFPLVAPIFLILCVLALVFHRQAIFYKQERLGISKRVFVLYKFRSMIHDSQQLGTGLHSYVDDDRITFFGRFLRVTSLDELPQLFNVLKGDMSFVGPRPAVLGELELEADLPEEIDLRFIVRPGLTGWAQIHGRNNLTWSEKAKYDLDFVKMKGLRKILITISILFITPIYLFNFSSVYEKRKS
jgi:undecaprenyl phosphate N,N'-diacetylbacillosamine 1-phosphate transferase